MRGSPKLENPKKDTHAENISRDSFVCFPHSLILDFWCHVHFGALALREVSINRLYHAKVAKLELSVVANEDVF